MSPFRIYDDLNLFSKLSDVGVIAGGSIVYALCDFVPKSSVGDIDVFVNTLSDFHTCVNILRPYATEYSSNCKSLSVVSIKTSTAIYQIIYKPFSEPYAMNVLESFDYDYVQCGYYKGKVYITSRCINAHNAREILEFCSTRFAFNRLKKAVIKGFKTPIIERVQTKKLTPVRITYEQLQTAKIKPMNTYYDNSNDKTYYSMKSVQLVQSPELQIQYTSIDGNTTFNSYVDVFIHPKDISPHLLYQKETKSPENILAAPQQDIVYKAQKELLLEVIKYPTRLFTESTMVREFLNDKDIAVQLLTKGILKCRQIPLTMWRNRDFVKEILTWDSGHIVYALKIDKKYADDEEIIRIVARSNDGWIWYASNRIKQNRTLILDIIKTEDADLDICDTIYQDDEEVILAQSRPYVMDASERLHDDVNFMIKVIKKVPINICYALCELPIDVIMDAVKSEPQNILNQVPESVRVKVMAQDGLMLKYINKKKYTPLIVGTAIMQNKEACQYV